MAGYRTFSFVFDFRTKQFKEVQARIWRPVLSTLVTGCAPNYRFGLSETGPLFF
jgi:hypothetical protein